MRHLMVSHNIIRRRKDMTITQHMQLKRALIFLGTAITALLLGLVFVNSPSEQGKVYKVAPHEDIHISYFIDGSYAGIISDIDGYVLYDTYIIVQHEKTRTTLYFKDYSTIYLTIDYVGGSNDLVYEIYRK